MDMSLSAVRRSNDAEIMSGAVAGVLRRRDEVPVPGGYAVFDCETTGVDQNEDEIVSLALIVLDSDGVETHRFSSLVQPSVPIPAGASAVHGIYDEDVAGAPTFVQLADGLLELLGNHVFVAHNASFDLAMLQRAFEEAEVEYSPASVACTLDAFRVLEPLADSHRLVDLCKGLGIELDDVHDALGDVLATAALVRVVLERGLAPESVQLDNDAFMRSRARGDTRPASEPQIRRVFALAGAAGLTGADGRTDREKVCELVQRIAGINEPDMLNREQVQDVFDELEGMLERRDRDAA
jgi:DNA polymerase III epsilon subunit family exonuclease